MESVAFTIDVPNLGSLEQGNGLNKNVSMGTFALTGDPDTSDTYTYTLGGTDANLFTLNTSTGGLSTGGSNISGSSGGTIYHITITATDTDEPAVQVTVPVAIEVGDTGSNSLLLGTGVNMAYGLNGTDTITGSSSFDAISGGQQNDIITGNGAGDFLVGGAGSDTFKYNAISDSQPGIANNVPNYDTIADFTSGSDKIDTSAIAGITLVQGALQTAASAVNAHSIAWFTSGGTTIVYANASGSSETPGSTDMEIHLTNGTSLSSGDFAHHAPAGVAGSEINLALNNPSDIQGNTLMVAIAGVPSDWTLNGGTNLGNGTWTIQTTDPSSLTITPAASFIGAQLLQVTESWTQADGRTATTSLADNVEAYQPGSPIFAWSGDDTLTGSSGHDQFVFSQPIGHDAIYNYDPVNDQIDLIGYTGFSSFSDVQAHTADDANGNAVITLGDGQTIALHGVDAGSLTATDFVFDQTPVTENAVSMTIGDGAMLPLSGEIHNSGVIELNSTGDETDLQLIEHGITLEGSGQVLLSDNAENVITGTSADVTLTNVDNTISGAGQIGAGQMTLVNEGTIDATGNNPLVIDTGLNAIKNLGTLEATGSGGLEIHSDVLNSGQIWANGGNVKADGAVTGPGSAVISGAATLEFAGLVAEDVQFAQAATGTLRLDSSANFTGTVSNFGAGNQLDLADIGFAAGASMSYAENQQGTGGTLTVSDGSHTANITLLGQYAADGFQASDDHHAGTLIAYHPPIA